MKKILLVLVFLAALTAIAGILTGIFFPERLSASNRRIKGSGTIVTRTIPARDFPPAGRQTKGRPRRISPRRGLSRSSEQTTDNSPFFEKIKKITTFERFCFKVERVCPKSNASAF